VAFDHETRRVAASNYSVQLTPFTLPGLHEAGDDRVCMARLTQTGQLVLDTAFKDELTGRPSPHLSRELLLQAIRLPKITRVSGPSNSMLSCGPTTPQDYRE
jgi:hypothetical protein